MKRPTTSYKQAYDLKPKDLRYRTAFERIRFEAAASIVHRGQKLRDDGKLDEAVAEFQKALDIDPVVVHRQAGTRTHAEDDRRPAEPAAAAGRAASRLERESTNAAGRWNWPPSRTFPSPSRCSPTSPTRSTAPSANWPESMCCLIPTTRPSRSKSS